VLELAGFRVQLRMRIFGHSRLSQRISDGLDCADPAYRSFAMTTVPLKRIATAEDVAEAVVYLASPGAWLVKSRGGKGASEWDLSGKD
jgi:NAD(P)-dependent dehydrogenase (short-subunit alcohol dehydrogenase family)